MRNFIFTVYSFFTLIITAAIAVFAFSYNEQHNPVEMLFLFLLLFLGYSLDERYSRSTKGISLTPGLLVGIIVISGEPYYSVVFCLISHCLAHLFAGRKNNIFNFLTICHEGISCYLAALIGFGLQNTFSLYDMSYRLVLIALIYEILELLLHHLLLTTSKKKNDVWNEIRDSILSVSLSIALAYMISGLFQSFRISGILVGGILLIPLNYIVDMFYQGFLHRDQLVSANKRLELLQESMELVKLSEGHSDGYKAVLKRIGDYFDFDSSVMIITGLTDDADILIVDGKIDVSESEIRLWIERRSEENRLGKMETNSRKKAKRTKLFLHKKSSIQLIVPLSTSEIILGTVIFEKFSDIPPRKGEIRMLMNIVHQLSTQIHDNILRKELYESNQMLSRKSRQLANILEIGNELKTNLDLDSLLDKIAKSVKNDLGFKAVLLSLIDDSGTHFVRVAQAGIDDLWEKIKDIKVPREEVTNYFKDEFLISKSYYINHKFGLRSDYDFILERDFQNLKEGWNQEDMLFIPVKNKQGKLIGVFSCDEPVDGNIPDIETIQSLEIFANQAAAAIEGAKAYEYMKSLGVKDGLTGLYNHRYFQETLEEMINSHRKDGKELGLLMIDLDDFKRINDEYGHPVGDKVLKQFARILKSNVREKDILARYGGEEFTVIFPDISSKVAVNASERIRKVLENYSFKITDFDKHLTISLGLAFFPADGDSREKLVEKADEALYRAKNSGKNKLWLASSN